MSFFLYNFICWFCVLNRSSFIYRHNYSVSKCFVCCRNMKKLHDCKYSNFIFAFASSFTKSNKLKCLLKWKFLCLCLIYLMRQLLINDENNILFQASSIAKDVKNKLLRQIETFRIILLIWNLSSLEKKSFSLSFCKDLPDRQRSATSTPLNILRGA